jgi:hypothetical protein
VSSASRGLAAENIPSIRKPRIINPTQPGEGEKPMRRIRPVYSQAASPRARATVAAQIHPPWWMRAASRGMAMRGDEEALAQHGGIRKVIRGEPVAR